jgi:glycerol-3-phosphate cytidylyltransferase-like family protein
MSFTENQYKEKWLEINAYIDEALRKQPKNKKLKEISLFMLDTILYFNDLEMDLYESQFRLKNKETILEQFKKVEDDIIRKIKQNPRGI